MDPCCAHFAADARYYDPGTGDAGIPRDSELWMPAAVDGATRQLDPHAVAEELAKLEKRRDRLEWLLKRAGKALEPPQEILDIEDAIHQMRAALRDAHAAHVAEAIEIRRTIGLTPDAPFDMVLREIGQAIRQPNPMSIPTAEEAKSTLRVAAECLAASERFIGPPVFARSPTGAVGWFLIRHAFSDAWIIVTLEADDSLSVISGRRGGTMESNNDAVMAAVNDLAKAMERQMIRAKTEVGCCISSGRRAQ